MQPLHARQIRAPFGRGTGEDRADQLVEERRRLRCPAGQGSAADADRDVHAIASKVDRLGRRCQPDFDAGMRRLEPVELGMSQRMANVPGRRRRANRPRMSATSRLTAMSIWSNADHHARKQPRSRLGEPQRAFFGPSNSRATPSEVSRCCTWRLTALCVTVSSWAASVIRPSPAGASKARRAFSESGRRIVIFPNIRLVRSYRFSPPDLPMVAVFVTSRRERCSIE